MKQEKELDEGVQHTAHAQNTDAVKIVITLFFYCVGAKTFVSLCTHTL